MHTFRCQIELGHLDFAVAVARTQFGTNPGRQKRGRKSNLMKQRRFFWVQMVQKLVLMHIQESNMVVHSGQLPRKNHTFSPLISGKEGRGRRKEKSLPAKTKSVTCQRQNQSPGFRLSERHRGEGRVGRDSSRPGILEWELELEVDTSD